MKITALSGAVGGAAITALAVAFLLHPAALAPRVAPSPAADAPTMAAPERPAPPPSVTVYVAGAVARPGVYRLPSSDRVGDAVAKAGGLLREADPIAVNLAAHIADGDEIAVPRIGETLPSSTTGDRHASGRSSKRSARGRHRRSDHGGAAATSRATADDPQPASIDLNTADAATLATIPGLGATLAERIVEFRDLNGGFASLDGLADVAGITPARFDAIAPYLTVRQP